MRLLLLCAAVTFAEPAPSRSLAAQNSLRVLRHTPGDSAMPTSRVTITFDRPIAGPFDQTAAPVRVLPFVPDIAGIAVWRDPVTLRFTPARPRDRVCTTPSRSTPSCTDQMGQGSVRCIASVRSEMVASSTVNSFGEGGINNHS